MFLGHVSRYHLRTRARSLWETETRALWQPKRHFHPSRPQLGKIDTDSPHQPPRVFEDHSEEYTEFKRIQSTVYTVDNLVQLVKSEQWDEAERVRQGLADADIPKNAIYERAAAHILRDCPNGPNETAAFIRWLQLLPDASVYPSTKPFWPIVLAFLDNPVGKFPFIAAFGIACASKGYIRFVRLRINTLVARFSPSDAVTTSCLGTFEGTAENYAREVLHEKASLAPPGLIKPPAPVDMIFETMSDEYAAIAADQPVEPHIPSGSIHMLQSLINEKEYTDAEQVRLELEEAGQTIPPSSVYRTIAEYIAQHPEYPDQVTAFKTWFSLIPPYKLGDPENQLDRLCEIIYVKHKPNLPLVTQFALICADKGYGRTVGKQAVNLVLRYSPTQVGLSFLDNYGFRLGRKVMEEDGVNAAMKAVSGIHDRAISILGIRGEENAAISVMQMPVVIGGVSRIITPKLRTMKYLLWLWQSKWLQQPNNVNIVKNVHYIHNAYKEHYPHLPAVPVYPAIMRQTEPSESESHPVAELVNLGDYDRAAEVLTQMQADKQEIPFDYIYQVPALVEVLRPNSPDRTDRFKRWFQLVPYRKHSYKEASFPKLRKALFYQPNENLELIMAFGLIAAEKGIANTIHSAVITAVVSHADVNTAADYVAEFQRVALRDVQTWAPGGDLFQMMRKFYGIAVRTYCLADRPRDAVVLLRGARETNELELGKVPLSSALYHQLYQLLERITPRDADVEADMQFVSRHRLVNCIVREPPAELSPAGVRAIVQRVGSYLSPTMVHVYPYTLVDFIQQCREAGRIRILQILRKRVLARRNRHTSIWILAEMLYYRRMRMHSTVVALFVDFFYLSGIPRHLIHSAMMQGRIKDRLDEEGLQTFQTKLWAEQAHISLVWDALVQMAEHKRDLESLYRQLLVQTEHDKNPANTDPVSGAFLPCSRNISTESFMPFITKLGWVNSAHRASLVLNDMIRLGVDPTVYAFTILAGHYAKEGDSDRALAILDSMERASPMSDMPQSNHVTYTNVIRCCIKGYLLDTAEEVERRMIESLRHIPGNFAGVEVAINTLRELRMKTFPRRQTTYQYAEH